MNKQILRLAIPNIISNLSISLLSSVDIILIGNRYPEAYIGALTISTVIFNLIYFCFSFLRMGTTGITAQAFGKKDSPKLILTLFQSLILALISSLLIIILQTFLSEFSFMMIDMSPEVKTLAQEYYNIRIWAAPATLGLYSITGWFFGMQNAILPMVLTILTNLVNILLSAYFVSSFDLNVKGVAIGTVIAQYSGLLIGIILLITKYRGFFFHFKYQGLLEFKVFKSFIILNRDIFIRTLSLILGFIFFHNQSSSQGDLTLAGNGILMQLVIWVSLGIDGFSYTTESLVGKYVGRNNKKQIRKIIKLCLIWSICLSFCYSVTYLVFGKSLLALFTDQIHIVERANSFLIWVVLFPLFSTPCYIWDGVYIGYTASKQLRNNMALSMIIYITFFYCQSYFFNLGNHGLWLSLIIFNSSRGFIQWIVFKNKIASWQ